MRRLRPPTVLARRCKLALCSAALLMASLGCATPSAAETAANSTPERAGPTPLRDIEGEPLYSVLPRDAIRAIDEPVFVSALEAQEFMQPDEPVIGIVGRAGTVRAYSAWLLERHEIVNDELDGRPIAATWCPLAQAGIVFARPPGSHAPLVFGVSGMLWHGALVMFDRESESLWNQIEGRAIDGPRSRQVLEPLPSTLTSWSEWVASHPTTEVLRKPVEERGQTSSHYADYFSDPERVFLPHLADGLRSLGPNESIFGVAIDGAAIAVAERVLEKHGSALVQVGAVPVLMVRDPLTGGVDALDARLAGDPLHLLLPDGEGGLATAHSIDFSDPSALRPLPVVRVAWYAWARTHPSTFLLSEHRASAPPSER